MMLARTAGNERCLGTARCCKDWVKHLETSGFPLTIHDEGNTGARQRLACP